MSERNTQILVVDDQELYRRALRRVLSRAGHEVVEARDASEAMGIVTSQPLDLVLCDVKMPGLSGFELVRQIRDACPDLPCIIITGYASSESSVEALRSGAFWYLEKPLEPAQQDVLRRLVDQAIEHSRLKTHNRLLQDQLQSRYRFDNIVGADSGLRSVLEVVGKVADTDTTVLITGESGTGKELIARALHYNSRRADRPLVTVNCGAIPEELLESELFGHVKGAFTNAVSSREGRFALADGGTIFLDEIGDMSQNLQVKLLRVLQEKSFDPVGSNRTLTTDVRVVAATNQDLELAQREGRFREDLFYRLNVLPIELPALRHRREDVPLLVRHFLKNVLEQEPQLGPCRFTEEALAGLVDYEWPGNVRELENLVRRLVILKRKGDIQQADLPPSLRSHAATADTAAPHLTSEGLVLSDVLADWERQLVLQALERTHWNKNQAAKLLGMKRPTLVDRIRRLGISPEGSDAD
ncbi:MAG: sigma-54 dependent transcriptional regulator [Myxococcota bacterium]|nr:sigma-54 dependent transcriptional regulator [Myxococcota bacterium]